MSHASRACGWARRSAVAGVVLAAAIGAPAAAAGGVVQSHPVLAPLHGTGLRPVAAASGGKLTYHGGTIMKSSTTYAIFWRPAKLQSGAAATMSATYAPLITRYFKDVGGSGLLNSTTQYFQRVGGVTTAITNASTFGGSWTDTAPYPKSGCKDPKTPGNCLSDAQIQAEVSKAIAAKGWTPGPSRAFFVFTAKGEGSCAGSDCAFVDYCAYHWAFARNGKTVIYANMPYAGTLLKGCGVPKSPNNDIDADSTINVTSHEHMEAVTDPAGNAWYDALGMENGDKCAWDFGSATLDGGKANQSWNGHFYLLQREWSNAGSHCVLSYP
jgi:hypothetical protein